jgi:hypothetical protein
MRYQNNAVFHGFLCVAILFAQLPHPAQAHTCCVPDEERSTEEQIADVNRTFDFLESVLQDLPQQSVQPAAMAKQIGSDPELLFEWVRDNTSYIPYQGVLRGSTGVLIDRQGNSLDRALLLSELLRAHRIPTRLVRGTLSVEDAKRLITASQPTVPPKRKPQRISPAMIAAIRKHAESLGLDTGKILEEMHQQSEAWADLGRRVATAADRQTDQLVEMLGNPEESAGDTMASAIKAAQDHWWIQYAKGETWVDLDPSLRNAQVGHSPAAVQSTHDIPLDQPADSVPEEKLHHQVGVRILVEQWLNGKFQEHEALSLVLLPSRVLTQPIQLLHVPKNWPKDVGPLPREDDLAEYIETYRAQDEWQPILRVGEETLAGQSFNDAGDVLQSATPSSPFGALGGALTGESGPKKSAGILTAEWIEYEVITPDGAKQTHRRELFDLVGPAARNQPAPPAGRLPFGNPAPTIAKPTPSDRTLLERNLALGGATEILPQVCELSPEFLEHLMLSQLVQCRGMVHVLVERENTSTTEDLAKHPLPVLPGRSWLLALARSQWSQITGCHLDQPNILTFHLQPGLGAKDQLIMSGGFDIVHNQRAVYPGTPSAWRNRLRQGVSDTWAETLLASPSRLVDSTAALYAAAEKTETPWTVVRTEEDLGKLSLSKDVTARIAADVKNGFVVVAPTQALVSEDLSAEAWWRIDPATGASLGIGAKGWGQAISEYGLRVSSRRWRGEGLAEYVVVALMVCVVNVAGTLVWLFPPLEDKFSEWRVFGYPRDVDLEAMDDSQRELTFEDSWQVLTRMGSDIVSVLLEVAGGAKNAIPPETLREIVGLGGAFPPLLDAIFEALGFSLPEDR